jgi:DNA-binding transcriptional ArsR family regulator
MSATQNGTKAKAKAKTQESSRAAKTEAENSNQTTRVIEKDEFGFAVGSRRAKLNEVLRSEQEWISQSKLLERFKGELQPRSIVRHLRALARKGYIVKRREVFYKVK